jgi:hypothetical protein
MDQQPDLVATNPQFDEEHLVAAMLRCDPCVRPQRFSRNECGRTFCGYLKQKLAKGRRRVEQKVTKVATLTSRRRKFVENLVIFELLSSQMLFSCEAFPLTLQE